jgi:methyltransferase (TIGR00027 family)
MKIGAAADTPIEDVSDTAFMVAVYRAQEGERKDALFSDPLSGKLAGERGRKIVAGMSGGLWRGPEAAMRAHVMAWIMAMRTCIIDDFIAAAVEQGADLILNLGAGLDTRPYRLSLPPSLHWMEVDYPHMIDFKESRLAEETPRCRLERVRLDLADRPARQQLFEDISGRFKNVLALTEGVLPYLSVEAAAGLADDLKAHKSFRRWVADYFAPELMRRRQRGAMGRFMKNAPFLFEPDDYFSFFEQHGWIKKDVRFLWDEGIRLNRPMPLPTLMKLFFLARSVGMSRERREARRRFMGYVLFEPAP